MPAFLFGIETEADIYCFSSKIALESDARANDFINRLIFNFIEEDKINLPMDEISDFIVRLCNGNVLNQIDNREDEQGVAWTIALLAKAYIAACSIPYSYDTLFKQCFIQYYH